MVSNSSSPGGQASAATGHGEVSASEIEKFLGGVNFPTDKNGLIEHAKSKDAPEEVLKVIEDFPEREFGSAADVGKAIGEAK